MSDRVGTTEDMISHVLAHIRSVMEYSFLSGASIVAMVVDEVSDTDLVVRLWLKVSGLVRTLQICSETIVYSRLV